MEEYLIELLRATRSYVGEVANWPGPYPRRADPQDRVLVASSQQVSTPPGGMAALSGQPSAAQPEQLFDRAMKRIVTGRRRRQVRVWQ